MSVTVASDYYVADGALLGYPRYKVCLHPSDSTHVYILFGNAQGSSLVDTYHSTNSGST